MTKKELLESDVFQALPDEAEIVFATGSKLKQCVALNELNLSAIRECINEDEWKNIPLSAREQFKFEPKYRTALVIDAIPYWYLKEKYNVTFDADGRKKK